MVAVVVAGVVEVSVVVVVVGVDVTVVAGAVVTEGVELVIRTGTDAAFGVDALPQPAASSAAATSRASRNRPRLTGETVPQAPDAIQRAATNATPPTPRHQRDAHRAASIDRQRSSIGW